MKSEGEWAARAAHLLQAVEGSGDSAPFARPWKLCVPAAIQLGREMADEMAEAIAARIDKSHCFAEDRRSLDFCAGLARSYMTQPKTREQVLEAALFEVRRVYNTPLSKRASGDIDAVIDAALEWKP